MRKPTAASERFAAFDVVIVPFPYSDRLAEKRRPALVVSAADLARCCRLVWVAMITSADNQRWEGDVAVGDFAAVGLPAPSVVRPVKIATVDRARILRRLGTLSAADARAVKASLKNWSAW